MTMGRYGGVIACHGDQLVLVRERYESALAYLRGQIMAGAGWTVTWHPGPNGEPDRFEWPAPTDHDG